MSLIKNAKIANKYVERCKGICNPHYDKRFSSEKKGGMKECKRCDIFVRVDGNICPCCKLRVRNANGRSWILKKNR